MFCWNSLFTPAIVSFRISLLKCDVGRGNR